MILAAATDSLLVSPVAYNPEASKFPIIYLFGTMLGFLFLAVQSEAGKLFCPNMDSGNKRHPL